MFRVGFGYDAHRLVEGRPLILGGIEVPYSRGLEGHSDADVLSHAVIDAVIGALAMGDIGKHFPDTDPSYKGASSLSMLKEVMIWVRRNRLQVNNLDATIVAEKPKLIQHIQAMRKEISEVLKVSENQINIKATSTEGMGFCGKGEGMEAFAIVSLVNVK
ncbi:MAG TPA: 2-C-methyl-D-erythritol 2,4-cyclodiphosphate synthase [Desulfobacteraceae bacterium]|nr:2-C-methyl-D-erythritol 2,4-cyclodiphosphate synthase [Desulfobacteraceae bacterium]